MRSTLLKICVFATGLAGIVAEYVMATMASYLLGDTVTHWTLIISWMLFAMGVGSRLSRAVGDAVLDAFVAAELALSVLVASSAPLVYLLLAWIESIGVVIYTLAFAIGALVGLELPLAARLNDQYEELRVNLSAVFEKDYYGALLGGVLFAFVGLPLLGLAMTPIVLGTVNFLVAAALVARFRGLLKSRRTLVAATCLVPVVLGLLAFAAQPIVLYGEQRKYRDRVVYTEQTRHQRIVITRWKDDHWLYLDGNTQFSTYDEERYHEPLVHPALLLAAARRHVLVIGGGDGLAVREVLRHPEVERVTLVDLDPRMTALARTHPVLARVNEGVLGDPRVEIVHADGYGFLLETREVFDAVVIDLPDPRSIRLARLYSRPFYALATRQLSPGGTLVTQATSPFFSRRAFLSILKTVRSAGLGAVPLHNHVPTMGEWGWVVGVKGAGEEALDEEAIRRRLAAEDFDGLGTRFLNRGGMLSMLYFGKGFFDDLETIAINEQSDLAVLSYYRDGAWDLF